MKGYGDSYDDIVRQLDEQPIQEEDLSGDVEVVEEGPKGTVYKEYSTRYSYQKLYRSMQGVLNTGRIFSTVPVFIQQPPPDLNLPSREGVRPSVRTSVCFCMAEESCACCDETVERLC